MASPDAIGGKWQISPPDADTADLSLVHLLITTLSSRYCIDRSRVFAAGISLGSEFAAIAGCTTADHIAAIGLVAAEFLLRPCAGPLPVIAFHGTDDPLVAYRSGGIGKSLPGVPVPGTVQNLDAWAELNRCRPTPVIKPVTSAVVQRTWTGCRTPGSVVLYTVVGGGHTWPGSPITLPVDLFGSTTHQVDATGLMLRFFARFHRES